MIPAGLLHLPPAPAPRTLFPRPASLLAVYLARCRAAARLRA